MNAFRFSPFLLLLLCSFKTYDKVLPAGLRHISSVVHTNELITLEYKYTIKKKAHIHFL